MSTQSWLRTFACALWQDTKSRNRRPQRRRTCPSRHGDLVLELLEDRRLLSVLGYSTYWGGSRNETAGGIATDSDGNTYVAGTTYSANLPGSSGPDLQVGRAFVTKFTASGQVAYSTILGPTPKWDDTGFAESKGFDLVIGPDDLPLVSFETFETQTVSGFPLPGPRFLHVAKLSDVGVPTFDTIAPVLDVADHLAPYSFTAVHLAVDDTGGAYAAYTALRETFGGGVALDPYITKVAPNGAVEFTEALLISVGDLALDNERNIYVATTTSLNDLPVTAGAFQPEKNAVNPDRTDIWIAKLDPTASALLGATYLGGAHNDTIGALAISPNQTGLVYLVGTTESDDFPVQNPLQPRPTPDSGIGDTEFSTDAFVAALDLTVSPEVSTMKLLSSTYFGGSRGDFLTDVAIDAAGSVYVVGSTNSADLPLANPLQPAWNDGPIFHELGSAIVAHDLIAAKFDASLTGLEFSTYLGGSGHDYQARLAVDPNGTIHVAAHSAGKVHDINGNAVSTADFPVLNAVQTTFGGGDPGLGSLETDAVVLAIGQRGVVSGIGSRATLGREFNDIVANFNSFRHTASPDDFTATIHWGDGTTSAGTVSRPSSGIPTFLVSGTHVYNTPGAFPVVVEVEDHLAPKLSPIRNINVSRNDMSQTGGSIAVDPTDPSRLFAAMTDEQGVANAASGSDGGILVATSRNGGQTWTPRVIGNAADEVLPRAAGDPDVLFDDFGNLFLAYRGVEGNNIVVAWSTDGGATFEAAAFEELVPPGSTGGTGTSAVGSPKLAFGAANHEIWVAFEDLANGLILAAGAGVGGVGDVGSFALKTVSGSNDGASSDIAIGPNGEVAVIWQAVPVGASTAQLLASFDLDGLGTGEFAMPTTVDTSTTNGELTTPAQQSPVPLGATLAWDTSDGPHRGRLYAAYVDMADDVASGGPELTLLTTFTDDLGVDWSDPSRVTLDAQFQSMFLPSIALDPETGNVAVGWYGTRGPLGTVVTAADFFVATTTDGQAFSEPQQVNAGAMDAFDPALSAYGMANGFGEAPSMAFLNRRLYPVWSDNSALGGENYYPSQFEVATSIVGVIDVRVPPVAIRPRAIHAIRGETFDGTVATFTHPDGGLQPADFAATIYWGDGAESPGTITQPGGPNTEFVVSGSHVFADAGAFPVWIEVHDNVHNLTATPVSSVNAERGSQAEATIAIDPTNPDRVFAAGVHVNFQWPLGIPIAASEDGGVTWTSGTIADGTDGLPPSIGDPKAVFDQYGNLFLTYLTPSPQRDVVVLLSTNGGLDFTLLTTFTDVDRADQPSIAVGPGEGGSEGSVWLTWERGQHPFQIIMAAGAPVHGLGAVGGFGQRLVAPLSADGFYRNFGDIAVGPDGQVLLTYVKGVPGATLVGPAEVVVHLDPDGLGWHTAVEPANVRTRFAATLSDDGGSNFRLAYAVSPGDSDATNPAIDPRGANFQYGDYTGIAFVDGVLQPIWADNSVELAANPDPPRFDLANARIAVAEVTRAPLVVETFNVEDVEGNEFTAHLATFTDPEGGGAASDYKATIHWGDGSEDSEGTIQQQPDGSYHVLGTHQYEEFGTWSISITITGNRTRGEGTATATIENAPLDVVIPAGLRVVREMEFTKVVATLSDLNLKSTASDFIVTIEWGDGSGSLATLELQPGSGEAGAPNTFNISGTHKYLSEDTFTINVSVLERASGQVLATSGELVSGDPPLIVNPGQFLDIEALAGINTGDLVLVIFERPDDIEVPLDTTVGEYTATINWGDGNVDAGITPFVTSEDVTVVGRHTYTTAGEYFPTVTLVDDSGGFFSAPLIATVELDVTSVVRAVGSGLIYNPATERFVGELTITNTSGADLPGPFFAVFHDLPEGVTLANITDVTGEEDPLAKVSVLKLQPGESLDPIPLEFDNPGRVPITYRVQVFDGIRSSPSAAASLSFEPNLGQTDAQVAFVARGSNYAIFLTPDRAALGLGGTSDGDSAAVHMLWLGGNESPTVIAMEPQAGTSNYLIGPDPSGWITSVPQYGRIRYESVYDRIDLEYYGRAGELEYDWIVRPGGDPNDIIMQFAGAESMTIDSAGNLRLTVADSELVERAPLVYQEIAGQRVDIPGSYVIHPDGTVGFALAAYDPAETLVIDPVLIYSTFFGPDATAQDLVVDDAGNAYITGTTVAIDFPTSAGVFQEESIDAPDLVDPLGRFYSRVDAFVLKVDPKGVPIFSTYLSGNYDDIGNAIAVDAAGYVYVAGNTTSTMFPTQNAFQANHADDRESEGFLTLTSDVFLTRLSPDGSRAEYSTYLGGQGNDVPSGIAVDATGAVYVVGFTAAADFPTKNAVLPFHPFDAFITKFDPSGSSLAFSTFLGGSGVDEAVGIVLDSSGDITVVGNTTSVDLPTHNALFDAYKPYTGPDSDLITALDLFVARLPADGSALDVLTYLGGTGGDEAFAIAKDDEGNIYLGGQTWSQDLPLVNPLQDSLNGQFDGFVVKLDPDLASILYSTYFGGSGREDDGLRVFDAIHDIAVDAQGNLIVAGETDSADLPVTAAIQPELAGESDWFLASLNATGSALNYLTYFGGADYDYLNAMAIDRAGTAVMAGRTLSGVDLAFDFPTFRAFDSTVGTTEFFANRMVFAKVASEPPPGFNWLELVHRTIAAVEGSTPFDGLVASVITVGTETAEDFTASINWGDGIVSAGTVVPGPDPGIPGRRQFSVLGSHLYEDVGLYDVVVTVRDSAGNPATATSTAAPQHGEDHALYHVVIDTTLLAGQSGLFSVQFNPGALPDAPNAELTLSGFSANGGVLSSVVETEGAASGDLADGATLQPTSLLNRLTQALTFGQRIELDLRISGDAIADPLLGPFGHAVAFQLLAADGVTPLLSIDPSGAVLTVAVDSDGATRSRAALSGPDASQPVAVASTSNIASVANAPLDVLLTPFSVQEGAEFSGTVATFTNENPLEALAGEHQAMIDWGDGSPATAGVITADSGHFLVTGTHRYRTAGEYPFHVTVTEPDGASVSGSESIAGNHFEASLLASIGALFAPVVADFNDDGEFDVAVGQSNLGANKAFITFGGVDFTFAPTQVVDIPTRFQAAAAGDFDNDGIVDLVVAGQIDVPGTESLSVVFGSRDGSLRVGSSTTPLSPYPPGSIATLDFDSDGNLDVVVGYGCGTLGCGAFVEVFRGLGDGAFERAGIHTAFLGSIVATGDLNGDGHPDIVVGSPLNISLLILLGDGAGFSGPATSVPLPGTTNSLAIADMNEDGVLDIVVGVGHLVVLTGAGDGTFTSVSHPAATTIYRIAVVDLNGDGRPDVVASDIDTTITVLLAEADGGFVTAQTMIGSQAREVLIGDFNRDGQFDVAIVGNSAVLRIYPGRGDGMVNVAQTIPSPTLQRDVLAADVNHDGFLDAISVANGIGIGGVLVSLGRGDGTFDTAPQLPLGTRATDPKPSAVAIADLNGYGRTEVLVGVPGGLAVFARNTDGSYAQSRVYPLTQSPFDMATGDLNGDGRTDIVAAISLGDFVPGNVAILLNAGDGTFAAAQYLATGEEAGSLVLRDLNADGAVDIAVQVTGPFDNASRTFPNSGIEVFHGRGDGTFLPGELVRAGVTRSLGTRGTIAAGDVDGDSIVDLVMAANGFTFTDPANPSAPPVRSHDGLYILLGNADGTYRPGQRYLNEPDRTLPSVQSATLGDFDGDGKLDVATSRTFFSGDRPDDVLVLLGNGDGTFGTETAYDAGLSATQLLSGDFDGDGSTDLVTAEPSVGGAGISLLLNQGDGTFGPAVSYFAGGGSWGIALGDLDSDGHLDVATANFDSGTVGLLLGRGDGTLIASRLSDGLANLLWSMIPGDLNRDGKLDLVVASSHSDYVDVLIGRGDGSFDAMPPVAIPNQTFASVVAPREMALADNNGDGQDELLVGTAVTGTVATIPILSDGSLGTPVLRTQSVGSRFAFGDFNGDGRIDAAAISDTDFAGNARWNNEARVLLAQADETFIAGAAQPTGTGASGVVAADVNHDGRLDLVIANAGDLAEGGTVNGGVVVLVGVGDGTFEAPVVYRPNESFGAIDIADLNGDGSLDLMLVRGDPLFGSERDISVMYNQGEGTFGPPEILDANSPYVLAAITAGDFAGDGLPDILVGSELFSQHVRVIRNVPLVTGALVTDAPIVASAATFSAEAGKPFTAAIGTFDDANPLSTVDDFTTTIVWGDGQTSPGILEKLPYGQYQVTGTHTYAIAGSFATRIVVVETGVGTHFATGQIHVASTDGNTPPVAGNDTAVTHENTAVVVAVLDNDQDVDGSLDPASVVVVAPPAHGTAAVESATGKIAYTPAAGYVGDDTFTYTVADDQTAVSNVATVSITVNSVPFILMTDGRIVTLPGAPDDAVTLRFTWTFDGSKREDEVWAYAVDDEQGTVAGVSPGDPDYAATVLKETDWWLIFQHACTVDATRDLILPGGTRLAFFVIQDDEIHDSEDDKDDRDHQDKSDDWCGDKPLAYFSLDAANPDGVDHLHDQQLAADTLEHAWETGSDNKNRDFDDVVYTIELVSLDNPPTMYTPSDPRPPFMPYRLGDVEDLELTGLDPSQEDLWYKLETTRDGILSVRALYDGPHHGVGLEIYDQKYEGDHDVRPVATGRIVDGGQRIDWPVLDSRKYYVRLTGAETELDLRLLNLVEQVGSHVTIHGTAGDDHFVFDAGAGHKVTINGIDYTFPAAEAATFSFDGSGGSDELSFTGSSGRDVAALHPTWGTFTGATYTLDVAGVESFGYDGGEGADNVELWGSRGKNIYTAEPGSGRMTGDGVSISVTAETIYARGNGGPDEVLFQDSAGDDLLEFFPTWARMQGDGYFHHVRGFKSMEADADPGAGGNDKVVFRGSDRNDYLKVNPYNDKLQTSVARFLSGTGSVWHTARGFDTIVGYGRGGKQIDELILLDTAGADTIALFPRQADLKAPDYGVTVTAHGFGTVEARWTGAGNGEDDLSLNDSPRMDHHDTLVGDPQQVTMSGPGYVNKALGFPLVKAYSSGRGYDTAWFSDLNDPSDSRTGADTFTARPLFSVLEGSGYRLYARLFDEVHAESRFGADVANLHGNGNGDGLIGAAGEVSLSGTRFEVPFANYARSFHKVNAFGGGGANTAVLTDAAVDLTTYDPPETALLEGLAQSLWLNKFAEIELRNSGTDERTNVLDVDMVFAWWE